MNRCRLPCSIGTQEAEDLSVLQAEGQRMERSLLAELLRDCREGQAMGHVNGRANAEEIRNYP
jgi:hypothetical protein